MLVLRGCDCKQSLLKKLLDIFRQFYLTKTDPNDLTIRVTNLRMPILTKINIDITLGFVRPRSLPPPKKKSAWRSCTIYAPAASTVIRQFFQSYFRHHSVHY